LDFVLTHHENHNFPIGPQCENVKLEKQNSALDLDMMNGMSEAKFNTCSNITTCDLGQVFPKPLPFRCFSLTIVISFQNVVKYLIMLYIEIELSSCLQNVLFIKISENG
jgi:hypothetical protein